MGYPITPPIYTPGSEPTVTMIPPATTTGLQIESMVVVPQSDGTFIVKATWVPELLAGGWSIKVTSGTTHVP